ncbi:MAG TPA: cytochrome b/b6 domain-containing protein [Methanosarcinaceae archaeon]|nr:cytochrome b/b6 domain-containing protein [Methanosarcinaceae archaeon]
MSAKMIERFSEAQIGAHTLCALSIMILYITGISLIFPKELGWIPGLIGLSEMMYIHRVAGVALIASSLYYAIYFALYLVFIDFSPLKNVFPGIHDGKAAIKDVLYSFHIGKQPEGYRKYNWLEKIDIFSVAIFDALIMGVTGIVIWMPWFFTSILPKSIILSLKFVHGSFAILSLCGILLHFYVVHLTPARFPVDKTMFTGYMDAHEVQHEYTQWYDEVMEGDSK